jgi:cytochrome c-type biogenesis protein CcsB
LDPIEIILFWLAMTLYSLAAAGYIYALTFNNIRVFPTLRIVVATGLLLHTLAIAARFRATGHLPWSGDYENALSGGWIIMALFVQTFLKRKDLQPVGVVILPMTLLLMGFGVMRSPSLSPMAASLKTFWLYIHVYFAMISFGAYTLAAAAGAVLLVKIRRDKRNAVANQFFDFLPAVARLDELMFRYVVFGFVTDAIMIAAGAIWAKDLWGSYWSWDPVETWSLISWLVYAFALHARLTLGWRMERFALVTVLALVAVFISYFGVTFIVDSSIHAFSVR